jgi:hypothetical protein
VVRTCFLSHHEKREETCIAARGLTFHDADGAASCHTVMEGGCVVFTIVVVDLDEAD